MSPLAVRLGLVLLALSALLAVAPLLLDRAPALDERPLPAATAERLERGRVLALAGHCAGCHTVPGGAAYAGGRAIPTPFGAVYAGNLTPDAATGLGGWSSAQFWRAMHHGRSADGRRLVPAFPYPQMTRLTREDSDALYLWLRTLPPMRQAAPPHALRWPYGTPLALATWRTLFFRPGSWVDDPAQGPAWNRGAYLVQGVAHCAACHGTRNVWGATSPQSSGLDFGGSELPGGRGHAPSLHQAGAGGVQGWPQAEVVALLRDGRAPQGRARGLMAEVVSGSLQHLPEADLEAMATYLRSLPRAPDAPPVPDRALRDREGVQLQVRQGAALYADHCASCHGATGEGGVLADGPNAGQRVLPPLVGNRLVTTEPAANLVRAIARGGFGVATAAHPRPFGMPPFAHVLNDAEIAALATFLRRSGAAQASPVGAPEVARWRGAIDGP